MAHLTIIRSNQEDNGSENYAENKSELFLGN